MSFDFDSFSPRYGRNTDKWDGLKHYGLDPEDSFAMGVADMDFKSPPEVSAIAAQMAEHGYFGYHMDTKGLQESASDWMAKRHNWAVDPDHILTAHGIVNAIAVAMSAFSEKGDGVAFFTPVYHAFARVTKAAERQIIELPLAKINNRYELDWARYETLITPKTKILILSSPHNPAGRIWSKDELNDVYAFAEKHDLIILNDEIHHDLIMPNAHFTGFENAVRDASKRTITLTSPSKTFNIAGNHMGNVIVNDPKLRATYQRMLRAHGISPNVFGLAMGEAAYRFGEPWLEALLPYLAENLSRFKSVLANIPGATLTEPMEATYLAWVDFSALGMDEAEVKKRVVDQAKIAPNFGPDFGSGGEDHLRFNIALPRPMLDKALSRLTAAFSDIQ